MSYASLIGVSRLRMGRDGQGITTLVAFHGCPLNCKYCLNPQCLTDVKNARRWKTEDVMKVLLKDELYYVATRGGATFGGGEPFLWSDFIMEIMELGAKKWHTTIETSLNVPFDCIEKLYPYVDDYIIDIKDMNGQIYASYTGKDNKQVVSNLKRMINDGLSSKMRCRVPLIPGYNNDQAQEQSAKELRDMGITRIDMFNYHIKG